MALDPATGEARDLSLLEEIERNPDVTQASLADRLDVAVGTVNWHIKRLIAKGYVKVKRAERRKLRYIITPSGISHRARLTVAYIESSMSLYRQTREQALAAIRAARKQGWRTVVIQGHGELAEVCRLTCLEQGMPIAESSEAEQAVTLVVAGRTVRLVDPKKAEIIADQGVKSNA